MTNRDKLKNLLIDVFLLEDEEFSYNLTRSDIESWDSLGVVSLAVGVQDTFGYHMTPEEATSIEGIQQIVDLLKTNGISFNE